MVKLNNILFVVFALSVPTKAIDIIITEAQQDYFHEVACASNSKALIVIFSSDSEKFSDEISELTKLSNESHVRAIVAGFKAGKTENQVAQFIELQAGNMFKANTKFIAKRGFDEFHKGAVSGLFALCSTVK